MQCLTCLGWPVVDISHNNPSPGQFVVVFTFWMCLHPFYSMFLLNHLCTHFIPMCIFELDKRWNFYIVTWSWGLGHILSQCMAILLQNILMSCFHNNSHPWLQLHIRNYTKRTKAMSINISYHIFVKVEVIGTLNNLSSIEDSFDTVVIKTSLVQYLVMHMQLGIMEDDLILEVAPIWRSHWCSRFWLIVELPFPQVVVTLCFLYYFCSMLINKKIN